MIDFTTLQGLTIPEGVVTQITDESGRVIWAVANNEPIVLEVEKITSDTYAGETTYTGEQFILLDIYPKTNGTVNITYGGLTKTITDTSGAAEPNAQQVYFGTFNGVTDSVETPASGTLTIEGDCYAFGIGYYSFSNKMSYYCPCICSVSDFGKVSRIPGNGFSSSLYPSSVGAKFNQIDIKIPSTIKSIGYSAFIGCVSLVNVNLSEGLETIGAFAFLSCNNLISIKIPKSVTYIETSAFPNIKRVTMLASTPPEVQILSEENEEYSCFGIISSESFVLEQIIVPKGCGDTYKTTVGWSIYADYIVEAS